MEVLNQQISERYAIYNGDCVEVIKGLADESVDYSIFSPPFSNLYTYSNSERDMGNAKNDEDFYKHFKFLADELFRIIKPGRLVSFHCMNIPLMKERDGEIGIKDFRGDMIRVFQEAGFIYHAEVCIWKDPLIEATRTKALGLMHKQLCKDSNMSRQGLPDYVVTMRKPGENKKPIEHPDGLTEFHGDQSELERLKSGVFSHNVWREYASPVWMNVRQTYTLNYKMARADADERHICPLQLDVIARCVTLWSNTDDVVFTPFMGVGSEVYQSLKMGRKAIGIELKDSYFEYACKHAEEAEKVFKEGEPKENSWMDFLDEDD